MPRRIACLSLLVPDYDEGIAFFTGALGFHLVEDTDLGGGKRWVRLGLPGGSTEILLARAVGDRQLAAVGAQGGGRVWLFLETDDFDRDHAAFVASGVRFEGPPRDEPYGRVAVFGDPWGNRWDLIAYADPNSRGGTAPASAQPHAASEPGLSV
jgi:catechol 2,3-dioxygenase-like lactoylglutathione lyase family enzyme